MKFNDENIQALFGYEDAESEPIERLREYYLKNETYERMMAELPIRLLVGHKGIGKSALFKVAIAEEREKGNLPILIKPDDIAELGKDVDNFLLTIRQWKFGLIKIIGAKVLAEFGLRDDSLGGRIIQFGGKLLTLLSDTVNKIQQEVEMDPAKKVLLNSFLEKKKVVVYVDDLDRGWSGSKEDILRLSALLNCLRDMVNENPGVYFKVAFRSDVYYLVRTSDESTDKIEGSVVWYSWTNHEILVMLVKRILTHFGDSFDEQNLLDTPQVHLSHHLDRVFESRFQGYGKWENVSMYRVLMSAIRKRPRDLVKLCTLAAREAGQSSSKKIKTNHLQTVFENYSQGRIQDTVNEYRSELPGVERLVFGMKPNRASRKSTEGYHYTTADLLKKIETICEMGRFTFASGRPADSRDLAQFLFKINFLTARKVLDDGQIDRKYFEENRYLSSKFVDFGYGWEVHPAYRWALQPDSLDKIFNQISLARD